MSKPSSKSPVNTQQEKTAPTLTAMDNNPAKEPMPTIPAANGAVLANQDSDGQDSADSAQSLSPELNDPSLYLNRELTWLAFNERVLCEAKPQRNPPLERLKFLSIFANNLDEFFKKRIGGLKQQINTEVGILTVDGRSPQQQIDASYEMVARLEQQRDDLLVPVLDELAQHGIEIFNHDNITEEERHWLDEFFSNNIYPLLTPQIVDPAHPFPFISDHSLNLLVTLQPDDKSSHIYARVKVPVGNGISRFVQINGSTRFMALEELIGDNIQRLFPDVPIVAVESFYVVRNAIAEKEETGYNDLLAMIQMELRDRRIAPIVRMVVDERMDNYRRGLLASELELDPDRDVFVTQTLLAQRDLMELATISGFHELKDTPHQQTNHWLLHDNNRNIFHIIRDQRSILLQHPYESFKTSVVRFLKEAANDPKVRAIKMTLYRTTEASGIVELLKTAAKNGKQVAVVVELKAKFDEAANIRWANEMEQAGIHVTFGIVGLKTHCKVILVVRQDYTGLRRYVHIGTGNYHAGTARLYSDLGLLTADNAIGSDITELFNYLTTGYTPKRNYQHILTGAKIVKRNLLKSINKVVKHHQEHGTGAICFKTNALEDSDIVKALYRASQQGVKINLIVRDTCRLRPGIEGVSENIEVVSIIGRFLEHSRIYAFYMGDQSHYWIGSADLMRRNLESRVEVLVKPTEPNIIKELQLILDTQINDKIDGWQMFSDGNYQLRSELNNCEDTKTINSQQQQISFAQQRTKKHKKSHSMVRNR